LRVFFILRNKDARQQFFSNAFNSTPLRTKHANKITTNQKETYHKANLNVSNDAWTSEEITPIESGRASVHVHSDQSTARIFNGSLAFSSVNHRLAICEVVQFDFGLTVEPASTERPASIALRMQPLPPDTTDLHPPSPDTTALQLRGSLQAVQMFTLTAIDILSTPERSFRGQSRRKRTHLNKPNHGEPVELANTLGFRNSGSTRSTEISRASGMGRIREAKRD
jgi:hypothetical protein